MVWLIGRILKLRLLQVRRTFVLLGPLYSLLILAVASFVLYKLCITPAVLVQTIPLFAATTGVILSIHLLRKDRHFLRLLTPYPQLIFLVEYIVCCLPVIVRILLSQQPMYAALCVLLLCVIAFLPVTSTTVRTPIYGPWKYISSTAYEWRTGIRGNYRMLFVLFIASLLLTPLPFISLFLVWMMNAVLCTFYRYNESPLMIDRRFAAQGISLSTFLLREQKRQLLVLLPPLVLYLGFHIEDWLIVVIGYLLLTIVYQYTIISKYAYYRSDQLSGPAGALQSMAQLSPLLPFLLPLPLIMGLIQYPKALKNIRSVRYAQH